MPRPEFDRFKDGNVFVWILSTTAQIRKEAQEDDDHKRRMLDAERRQRAEGKHGRMLAEAK